MEGDGGNWERLTLLVLYLTRPPGERPRIAEKLQFVAFVLDVPACYLYIPLFSLIKS